MSVTHLRKFDDYLGARTLQRVFEYVGLSSYTTGGEGSIKSKVGLTDVLKVDFYPIPGSSGTPTNVTVAGKYRPFYDFINDKIVLILFSTDAEVANAADASDACFRVVIHGS